MEIRQVWVGQGDSNGEAFDNFANAPKEDKKYHKKAEHLYNEVLYINLLTPNVNYSGRNAPLTSKVAFHIFIQQI